MEDWGAWVTEELEVLETVARRLEATGIRYMVTGSFAANYYAVPRMTRDIDLVVELSADDADRFCASFEGDFYLDRDAVRAAIASRGVFNLIHQAHVIKVDCIVRKDSDYRRTEFARQRRGSIEGTSLAIVAPEDLIISKLDWMRESRSPAVPDLDRQYLAHWTERLGLGALYREALGDRHPAGGDAALPGDAARAVARGAPEDGLLDGRHGPGPGARLGPGAGPARLARRAAPRPVPALLRSRVRGGRAGEDHGAARPGRDEA